MVPVLYYFQLMLLNYLYPVDTPETPPEFQSTVVEQNQSQPEDKPSPGTTLCSRL